ncbi:MAG: hypothetical protein EBZ59_11345 [Planctomycetia bacterium]|nr:hypothetical protein [Planctomycetia bacterium]
MTAFCATHRITTWNGFVDVMLSDDGAAYTREEWESETAADYERNDDGEWTCQGKPFSGTVEVLHPYACTTAERTQLLYFEARARVERNEQLSPYAETILADYPEGDEHLRWVIDADADEILAWAEAAR